MIMKSPVVAMAKASCSSSSSSRRTSVVLRILTVMAVLLLCCCSGQCASFYDNYMIYWGHTKVVNNSQGAQLILDQSSGSGIVSLRQYLFGFFSMRIKLIPGNSAGTVTSFYLTGAGQQWDEVDFEFLGNKAGEPIIVQTNVFMGGKGMHEQRIHPWFDPTSDYHNYTILWNPSLIMWSVDGVPIRVFSNAQDLGVPFPHNQSQRVMCSLWNGDDWATDGGRTKIDWSYSPFVANYQAFDIFASCQDNNVASPTSDDPASSSSSLLCPGNGGEHWWENGVFLQVSETQKRRIKWVRRHALIYDYCADREHYPTVPPECFRNGFQNYWNGPPSPKSGP